MQTNKPQHLLQYFFFVLIKNIQINTDLCFSLKYTQFLTIDFILTNSADPGDILLYAAFHQGLHFLSEYPFRGFQYTKANLCTSYYVCLNETKFSKYTIEAYPTK